MKTAVPSAVMDLRYATTNNFTHQAIYPEAVCFLRAGTAEKLRAAEADFEKLGLRVKLFDCYRPLSVQRKLWALVPDERYVANPSKGSRHNRGAAVDLALIRAANGRELDMGTGFDDFSERAHRGYTGLSDEVQRNRRTLDAVMTRHGFVGLPTEWWHFDDTAWEHYPVTDRPLSSLQHP